MIKQSNIIKNALRDRRRAAIRKRLRGTSLRPRLVVFRSHRHIYAQIIDDSLGRTLVSASSREKNLNLASGTKKTKQGLQVGQLLGEKAQAAGITKVCFDRAGYKYHGRVKALADGARKAGLDF